MSIVGRRVERQEDLVGAPEIRVRDIRDTCTAHVHLRVPAIDHDARGEWLVLRVLDYSLRAFGSVAAEYAATAGRTVAIPRLEEDLV